MRNYIVIKLFCFWSLVFGQPNCNIYLYENDTIQYRACEISVAINKKHYQFSKKYQDEYDSIIKIAPNFAYAYQAKSVAYAKSGDFLNWKILIDKAVELDPIEYLGYRGWCKFQFFRDYEGAIKDFEDLEQLTNEIGYSANGNYHLLIAKAICYSAIGNKTKAIKIFEDTLKNRDYSVGIFDYYQLGVTYFEVKEYKKAMEAFIKQSKINQLAENVHFISKINLLENDQIAYSKNKLLAIQLYKEGKNLFDPYTHHYNKVYLLEIEK